MSNINFIYTENGERKTDIDEWKRRCEIARHNQWLQEEFATHPNIEDKDEEYDR